MNTGGTMGIRGKSAAEIAASIRSLVDAGELHGGETLPAARELARDLDVNRNTTMAAYRQLALAGVVVSNRGGGTTVAPPVRLVEEGFTPGTALRDVSHGNPDRRLLPDPTTVRLTPGKPVLYGESTVDADLARWAMPRFEADQPRHLRLTITGGAVDAVAKLLSQALTHGDTVALEDPCFLTSINTVRQAGYRPAPVAMDDDGMTTEGLRTALQSGARAVVCTPRAHNPTGASLTARRARELRAVLVDFPHVLVIEDDHFSLLSSQPYHSLIPPDHDRWALVRSVSKFLGPDMRLAVVASDPGTAEKFATQISAGTQWVSHHVQRTVHAMLASDRIRSTIDAAADHYLSRNERFTTTLRERGIRATGRDGVNIWVDTGKGSDADAVAVDLLRRGWVARTGSTFALGTDSGRERLRLTIHELDDDSSTALADALADALSAAPPTSGHRFPRSTVTRPRGTHRG